MTIATAPARLLNPATYDGSEFDPETQRVLRATIDWFEAKGFERDSYSSWPRPESTVSPSSRGPCT